MFEGAACVDHAQAAAAGTCRRCGAFLCVDCALGGQCQSCAARAPSTPQRIGGWLVFPMLALFGLPLMAAVAVVQLVVEVKKYGLAPLLEHDPQWLALNGSNAAIAAAIGGYCVFVAPGFFRKRRVTVFRMQALYAAVFAGNVVVIVSEATGGAEPSPVAANVWPIVMPIVWILYFRKSKRVAATFVRD